ncbi:MAG: GyrI-like domain-containing protein [Oscillospiraceae bacterium]|nr:GyrI-like domain-containing protein [Oscillospiraceae bacterium]
MAEIIKTYKETLPAVRLIGTRYGNNDRDEYGGYGGKWGEWFQSGQESSLSNLHKQFGKDMDGSYLGFMRCNNTDDGFEYWIGMFFPQDTAVPEGYDFLDVDGGEVGVCWIKGSHDDGSIYGMHGDCAEALKKNNMGDLIRDGYMYSFERYSCPRFTEKDSDGNVILDYGIYLGK